MSNTFQRQIVSIMEEMATSVLTEINKGFEGSATLCIEMSGSHENKSKVMFPMVQSETRMAQLASVIEILAQEAVNKICDLAMEDSAVLRLEVSQSQKEIGTLKRKLELMEKELRTLNGGVTEESSPETKSVIVKDACDLREADIEQPYSAVVSLCGNAVPTVAPLQRVSLMAEAPDVGDGIESVIIKEERFEEDLESRHLEGRLDFSKEGMRPAAHRNCVEARGLPLPAGPDRNETTLSGMDGITEQLISWRGAHESLFTGKRNAAVKGFEMFIREMGLEGKVTVAFMKKKWENLKQKYKELKNLPNGRSTEGGEMTAATWKWYWAMDKVLGSNHSITYPTGCSPSTPGGTVLSFSPEEKAAGACFSSTAASRSTAPEAPSTSPPLKRTRKEPEWFLAIKELEKREEARDVREAEWERVMMEREERREREMMEREERREREMMAREERRDREMREREERLIRESRDREERRARQAAAREARFLSVVDFLLKK